MDTFKFTKKINVHNFDIGLTLKSGQLFSYKELENNIFLISTHKKMFLTRQKNNTLFFSGRVNKDFVESFFSLDKRSDKEYKKRIDEISKDRFIASLVKKYTGLRIMKQDIRECTLSFICSSISNIPKIKRNIDLLSKAFGRKGKIGRYESYMFPDNFGSYKEILACKTGFRAKYLYKADKILNKRFIQRIKRLEYNDAKKMLMTIPGVGNKIADCVCLFSLEHYEAFPVDVWIKRIVSKKYLKREVSERDVEQYCKRRFGRNAGLAQQFLYVEAIRNAEKYR